MDSTDWIDQHMARAHGLSHPDWNKIYEHADADIELQSVDKNELWNTTAYHWLSTLSSDLGKGYSISQTDSFMLVTNADDHYTRTLLSFLEACLKRILRFLKGIADDGGYGKYAVMVFDNSDTYYDYISFYGPQEGTYGLTSGMYLNYGYGHFVFPHQDIDNAEPIIAHEMTHALLAHLPIPTWLNEGLAVNMEAVVTGYSADRMSRETFAKHQAFWGPKEIQEFWMGSSFSRPDEGQRLSYQLAEILVKNLAEQYGPFVEYCNQASWEDAGESALESVFDLSLGDMISNFLGDGEWQPKPSSWPQVTANPE